MTRRTLRLRREPLVQLTEADLRAAVGADQQWSADAFTCLANTCRSLFRTMCRCD